jgi:hypothetical protein
VAPRSGARRRQTPHLHLAAPGPWPCCSNSHPSRRHGGHARGSSYRCLQESPRRISPGVDRLHTPAPPCFQQDQHVTFTYGPGIAPARDPLAPARKPVPRKAGSTAQAACSGSCPGPSGACGVWRWLAGSNRYSAGSCQSSRRPARPLWPRHCTNGQNGRGESAKEFRKRVHEGRKAAAAEMMRGR